MHFLVPLPIIMFFIVSSLLIFCIAISVIFYNACVEVLIPLLEDSRAYRQFIARISQAVYFLFLEIRNDALFYLGIVCESDGDDEEVGFDDDYHQCETFPDCDIVKSSPKEEVLPDPNNNRNAPGRAARRRRVLPLGLNDPPVNRRPGPAIRLPANPQNPRAAVPPVRIRVVELGEDDLRELVEF
ncbi:hypothetical protein Ocin01_11476 [Orchesella cincta]|uniref:Uncharacterized protein n=1 Tax=Orchesella cincta TaxID=48709 RepID=A0A1D2MQX6_ORCCI|nr:hypothetical protein Ocin01_11476 [Orchesella cincta]